MSLVRVYNQWSRFRYLYMAAWKHSVAEFLKEHWFKLTIVVILVLIAIFVNNYFQSQMTFQKLEKDRQFAADQKEACLGIYKQESSKWNNASGWSYDSKNDQCYIQYKASPKQTEVECKKENSDENGKLYSFAFKDYLLCTEGLFEKVF